MESTLEVVLRMALRTRILGGNHKGREYEASFFALILHRAGGRHSGGGDPEFESIGATERDEKKELYEARKFGMRAPSRVYQSCTS